LRKARERNDRLQLTGMLLYRDGRFMGVLEGSEANVRSVLTDIEQDGRHKDLDILRSERILHRNFSDWTMGFASLDSSLPAFTRFLEAGVRPEYFDEDSIEAHAMLSAFKHAALLPP
jgi:hypothetical protein